MVRRVIQDNKVPGTSAGMGEAKATVLAPAGSTSGFLGESQAKSSLPCQVRFEQHQEGPGCLKSQWGNKDKVANTQGQGAPTETMDATWEELGSD